MKKFKSIKSTFFLFISVLLNISVLFAQTEKIGFQNLLIPSDASFLSSAQSNSAIIDNSASIFVSSFINPLSASKNDISFSHYEYIADLKMNSITARVNLFGKPLQFGWQKLGVGGIEARDRPIETPQSTFESYWMTFAVGSTVNLWNSDFGITYKFVVQKLYIEDNTAHLFDISFSNDLMRSADLMFVSLQNIGIASKLKNQDVTLPTLIKTGWIFYKFQLDEKISGQIVNESSFLFTANKFISNTGIELKAFDSFTLRTGYRLNHDSNPFAAGLGIKYGSFKLDYAFNYFSTGLNSTHAFSFSYDL